ncbi:MAG: tryptophan 7-halogenase [Gammaproteobacteria bacterium]|jgi:tryptophan halogenase
MSKPINKVVVAGGGSAGFLAALSFRIFLPRIELVVVYSADIPVIGVGESTTQGFVDYLHKIVRLDRGEFMREVRPSWKLGLRLEWGDPSETHFNYPFERFLDRNVANLEKVNAFYCLDGMTDTSHYGAMMDRDLAPCRMMNGRAAADPRAAYHIPNPGFIAYLQRKVKELGADVVDGEIVEVNRQDSGDVRSLRLADGREIEGDFFVDCSGFKSLLLKETMGAKFQPYSDTLLCDAAVVGSWDRPDDDTSIHPYTKVETMDHGWCWQIDFLDLANRGYVFSSAHCSTDEAMREMKDKNPALGDDLRLIRFPSGRHDRFWIGNVAGVGNSSAFVEPLESTALHLIASQCSYLVTAIRDGDRRPSEALIAVANRRFGEVWDDVRDFLALHYRYNRRLNTPFWQHCREKTSLGGAEELVATYAETGPAVSLAALMPAESMFGYTGYMNLLIGQRVPTKVRTQLNEDETRVWQAYRQRVLEEVRQALPMKEALLRIYEDARSWPKEGI